jgi:hypothetical protein
MPQKQPRHEVISLRLNEDRLALLERHRAVLSSQLGRDISLAEAAFMAFEGRAPQLDREAARHELLQTPTASLARIRKRWATEHALSLAEWDVLAEYLRISTEEERQEPPVRWPAIPSAEAYLELLDAFEAVYAQRIEPASKNAWAYFSHLGGLETSVEWADADSDQRHQALLSLIDEHREILNDNSWMYPGSVGRCLLVAIRDEGVDSATLDRVLGRFWPTLWALAARGHWIRHEHQPVRLVSAPLDDVRQQIHLPAPFTASELTLSFASPDRLELVAGVDLGPTRRCRFTVSRYPELIEFGAMLLRTKDEPWQGRYFSAVHTAGAGDTAFVVTRKASEMAFDLTEVEFHNLRALYIEAWGQPEVSRWLSALGQEYGEQGGHDR